MQHTERFWAKVARRNWEECWLWQAGTSRGLDHLCRTSACVNPAHLEPVTHRENVLRGESPSAQNAERTHCPKGHPLSGDNLHIQTRCQGRAVYWRTCRQCRRDANNHWNAIYARRKANA